MNDKISLKLYYKTKHWIQFSKKLLEDKECECALCHRKRWLWQVRNKKWKRILRFAVHHINYEHLNEEENYPNSYMTLCFSCHDIAHTILRYKNISPMYKELSEVVIKHGFIYKKEETS